MAAIRTCPGPVAWIPAEVQTAEYRAVKGVAFAVFPEDTLTGLLVRISLAEISQIHSNSFLLDNNTAAKSAPSTMMAVQTLLNLDDCGYSFFIMAGTSLPCALKDSSRAENSAYQMLNLCYFMFSGCFC